MAFCAGNAGDPGVGADVHHGGAVEATAGYGGLLLQRLSQMTYDLRRLRLNG